MNTKNLWGLFIVALCFMHQSYAQDYYSCENKVSIAKTYLDFLDILTPELKEQIVTNITPCISEGNVEAAYIKEVILLEKSATPIDREISLSIIEDKANKGDTHAMMQLGLLYKKGIGTEVDTKQSRYWFQKANNKGNQFAKYALGYLSMKGLGGATQDYNKAKDYYTESKHPMAKHWLGIMNYYGYGFTPNPNKGLELLKDNSISNSTTLAKFLESGQNPAVDQLSKEETALITNFKDTIVNINPTDIILKWKGKVVELDWGKKYYTRNTSFDLSISYSQDVPTAEYTIKIADKLIQGTAIVNRNMITFDKAIVHVPNLYKDNPEKDNLVYQIEDITFTIVPKDRDKLLVGKINGTIQDLQEPMPPLYVILKYTAPPPPPTDLITDIKVSPNPTSGRIKVGFTLAKSVAVRAEVLTQQGGMILTAGNENTILSKGANVFSFNLTGFTSGSYIVVLHAEGKKYTRRFIKN